MKNRVFNAFLLLALVGTMFTACKKEYPTPPIQDLPIGRVYTISEILALEPGTVFNEDASVYGIITADEVSGNLYKAAFMQDRATGAAIELYLNAVSGVRIGDSVRIYLKDVTYAMYNNLPQLSNFEADGHIVILANNKPIEPALATIDEITQGKYLAGLVRLENVKFTEQNTFADPTTYGNRTLIDPMNPSSNVIVRTSNYANFANDSLPQGIGNLTAIATVYNSTWQLIIRSARELEFDGYVPGGANDLPYCEFFASSFGSYTTYDVKGAQHWEIDYSTAKMTGYENSTNYENEDWLISAKFSLENVSSASMTVSYIARYFNNVNEDVTVWVSSDYTSGDPNSANWEQIPATWVEGSNWNDFATTTLDLSQFLGKKVCVAVKYRSDNNKAGTIEVQSICIQEGSGPTPPPGPGTGGELQTMPYTQSFTEEFGTYMTYDVLGPQSWMIDYHTAKMTGYAGGSNANEDWLISSPVAVTNVSEAKVSVTYSAQYQNADNGDVSLQVSTDYVFGNDPTTANWINMQTTYPNTANFNDFQTIETSLNEFIGQNVTVAIKYTSTASQSRTIEIQSITVQEGAGVTPPTPPTPGEGEGSGTADDPYNVAAGIGLQDQGVTAWVQGYIVGAVKSGPSSVSSNDDISWAAPFTRATNVLIADDPTCNEVSNCIIIELGATTLKSQVNLVDNPGNLGKHLTVLGTFRKYFGQSGLRDCPGTENDFVLEGGDTPTPPNPGTTEYFNQTLTTQDSYNTFTAYSVAGDQEWYQNSSHLEYGAVMSGYANNTSFANEDWFISPIIDLSGSTSPILNFEHARGPQDSMNVGVEEGYYTVWVTNDYPEGADPSQERWVELPILNQPTTKWQFVSAGDLVIPAEFKTATCRIAFRYLSADGASATWEIKNVVVKEQ